MLLPSLCTEDRLTVAVESTAQCFQRRTADAEIAHLQTRIVDLVTFLWLSPERIHVLVKWSLSDRALIGNAECLYEG